MAKRNNNNLKDNPNKKGYNGRKKPFNKKGSNKPVDKDTQEVGPEDLPNNPQWYFLSEEVKNQCSQLSFQEILGNTKPLNEEIPNVMRIYMNPSPGVDSELSSDEKSGFNAAMFRFYSQLSAFTGRTQSYAPQDIGMVVLALGELVSTAEFIRRAFGISAMTNERNYSYPKYIVEAMSIDPDDFSKHRADYRDRFNFLLTRINSLPIPKNLAYIQKCLTIYQNVFLDDPSPMATSLVYLPASTWRINETFSDMGTFLETRAMCLTVSQGSQMAVRHLTMEDFLDVLDDQITRLQNSSIWAVVYSDILNYAAKQSLELLKLDYLSTEYAVMPSYNIEAVLQIKHMNIMTAGYMCKYRPTEGPGEDEHLNLPFTAYNDVWPDIENNSIIYDPLFHPDVDAFRHDDILSVPVSNPSADLILESTRFMASYGELYTRTLGDVEYTGVANCHLPDHWVVYVEITGNGNNTIERISSNEISFTEVSAALMRALSKVSCAPFLYMHDVDNNAAGTIGDYAYFTTVPSSWIDKLIRNVSLGLYVVR